MNNLEQNNQLIADVFKKEIACVTFITAGDPSLDKTAEFILEMDKRGADIIEIGIPFSDPIAEGPVIQGADQRALAAGFSIDKMFAMVESLQGRVKAPLLFMTYINPIFTYGKDKFFSKCSQAGIVGVIVPDMPYEEKDELLEFAHKYGLVNISLIAPTSEKRITMIAKEAEGFIYCVSSLGVTGVRSEIKTDIGEMVRAVRTVSDRPVAVGFGIATPEQAKQMGKVADGAIVGSAIIKIVEKYGAEATPYIGDYVESMKKGLMEA